MLLSTPQPCCIVLQGLENQNRAVPGDLVAIQILPQSQWLTQRVNIMSAVKKLQPGWPLSLPAASPCRYARDI